MPRRLGRYLDLGPQQVPDQADRLEDTPKALPRLPASCPFCGAPLRSDQVEWIDERRARCAYCGSPVKAGE